MKSIQELNGGILGFGLQYDAVMLVSIIFSYAVLQCYKQQRYKIHCYSFYSVPFCTFSKGYETAKKVKESLFQCLSRSLLLSLKVQLCPWMMFKQCCMKEQFCVLLTEDLEQKDGDAQWPTVRHMLSIKMPAINTRYTAPGQQYGNPLG